MVPISRPRTEAFVSGKFSQPGRESKLPSLFTCIISHTSNLQLPNFAFAIVLEVTYFELWPKQDDNLILAALATGYKQESADDWHQNLPVLINDLLVSSTSYEECQNLSERQLSDM